MTPVPRLHLAQAAAPPPAAFTPRRFEACLSLLIPRPVPAMCTPAWAFEPRRRARDSHFDVVGRSYVERGME